MKYITVVLFVLSCQTADNGRGPEDSGVNQIGVVSSAHPFATKAGLEILAKGGNAFDAAVTIAATLNVVEPMMSGVGGYGTILVYDSKQKKVRYLDSSGKIPINTNSDLMREPTPGYLENRRGPKAVSTPGNVNAWYAMSSEFGLLNWSELFESPVELAEQGILVNSGLAGSIRIAFSSFSDYTKQFYGKEGKPLVEGDTLYQVDLAKTLNAIASIGPKSFYTGQIAQKIHGAMIENGGFLSYTDLEQNQAEWWDPIHVQYKDYVVYTSSPPSTAFPSLIRLGLMQQFKGLEHNSAEYLHYFAESTKKAYADRLTYAGDPELKPPPLDLLLSESYWQETATSFNKDWASEFAMPNNKIPESKNTTHFVVADKWGNIVSATQTLGNLFGSRIMPEGTGIWLNNSLAYCTYEPKGNPMDAIPGQRKLSGDCPTIIFKNDRPWVALGTPGGHTIGQTVPQMVLNFVEFGMTLDEAIRAPRVSFIEPRSLALEFGISEQVYLELQKMGHHVTRVGGLGLAHALMIHYDEDGNIISFEGVADNRGEGSAEIIEAD